MTILLGPDWQRTLWASPYRLRYELNQGGPYINMFTAAYDRARALARAALPGNELIAIVAAFPDLHLELPSLAPEWIGKTPYELLQDMGVGTESHLAEWQGYWWESDEEDDERLPMTQRAVRIPWDQADILLWNQTAFEIGIRPRAPVFSKLVDLERGVSVNAYDDRGMDITAVRALEIEDLYRRFAAWLLDYDLPRMEGAFGPL